jgi:hypothetical protein
MELNDLMQFSIGSSDWLFWKQQRKSASQKRREFLEQVNDSQLLFHISVLITAYRQKDISTNKANKFAYLHDESHAIEPTGKDKFSEYLSTMR